MPAPESKSFRFLSDSEFSMLDVDAKALYLIAATKAVAVVAADITAHVKRRDDEAGGKS